MKMQFVRPCVDVAAFMGMPTLSWQLHVSLRQLYTLIFRLIWQLEPHEIIIRDARARHKELDYATNGFTLLPFNSSAVSSYITEAGQQQYQTELEHIVRKLHPKAKTVTWTSFLLRGEGLSGSNPPATDGAHLDNYQNISALREFTGNNHSLSNEKEQLQVTIGFWKPIQMSTPVCDYPLTLMDAASFKPQHQVRFEQHFSHIEAGETKTIKNLASHVHYHKAQRWYYYSAMSNDDLLVLRHYTQETFLANVHAAFHQPSCPDNADTRKSIETRAYVSW